MLEPIVYPYLGYGLGLRACHLDYIFEHQPSVDWFEIVTENYMVAGGRPHRDLERIRAQYPIVFHGVSLSVGNPEPLNMEYLQQLRRLADQFEPAWVSDHLCWTGIHGYNTHDLLPLPYNEAMLAQLVERIGQIQDYLQRRIVLENPSSYVCFKASTMTEWEFLAQLSIQADCLLLLDINNVYVSSYNHQFDPNEYLNAIPLERVQQFHLAGHNHCGDYIIDTHDSAIIDPVWQLYRDAVARFGTVSTMIERDANIPPCSELLVELNMAKAMATQILTPSLAQAL